MTTSPTPPLAAPLAAAAGCSCQALPDPVTLALPYTKPPLATNERLNLTTRGDIASQIRRDVADIARAALRDVHAQKIRVELHYRPLRWGRSHADNTVTSLLPMCQGLADAGVVPSDTPVHMDRLMPHLHPVERGRGAAMWLTVQVLQPARSAP